MFYLFHMLMFIHYISIAKNIALNNVIEKNTKLANGVNNESFPTEALFEAVEEFYSEHNLEHNVIDKSLSDEMLSNKENINDAGIPYTADGHKYRHNDETPKRDGFDELNKNDTYDDKRLMAQQNDDLDFGSEVVEKKHVCQMDQNTDDVDASNVRRSARMCTGCTRTTMFYAVTLMPYYIPYQPYLNYAPYLFNDGFNTFIQQNKDNTGNSETPRSIISKETPSEDEESNIEWDTAFLEARPDVLVTDLLNDLYISYPNAVINKCHCSSLASQQRLAISCTIFCLVIYLFFIIVK